LTGAGATKNEIADVLLAITPVTGLGSSPPLPAVATVLEDDIKAQAEHSKSGRTTTHPEIVR